MMMTDEVDERKPGGDEVLHLSIKPPAFMETSVNGWFTIMEAQFHLKHVTSPQTKFYHVISSLPAEVVARVPPSVLAAKDYTELKDTIEASYERTKPEMLDKLISSTPMCGRPSSYLQDMITLASKIGVGDDIVRHKFLQALPKSVSPVVASQKDLNLSQLGKLADELIPYFTNNQTAMTVNTNKPNYHEHKQQNQHQSNTPNTNCPPGLRAYNPNQRPKVCRAHLYYGPNARTCKPWCTWPNKSGVKIHPNSRSSSPAPPASSQGN